MATHNYNEALTTAMNDLVVVMIANSPPRTKMAQTSEVWKEDFRSLFTE
jgi:hypothetical protein